MRDESSRAGRSAVDPPQQIADGRRSVERDVLPDLGGTGIEQDHLVVRGWRDRGDDPAPSEPPGLGFHPPPGGRSESQGQRRVLDLDADLTRPARGQEVERAPRRARLVDEVESHLGEEPGHRLLGVVADEAHRHDRAARLAPGEPQGEDRVGEPVAAVRLADHRVLQALEIAGGRVRGRTLERRAKLGRTILAPGAFPALLLYLHAESYYIDRDHGRSRVNQPLLEQGRKTLLVVLFVPSVERDGITPIDQDLWVDAALEMFGQLFGGATAYPKARGIWRDEERDGALVKDEPVLIHCYMSPESIEIEANQAELGRFCRRMGRETGQGEVGLVVGDEYFAITDFSGE